METSFPPFPLPILIGCVPKGENILASSRTKSAVTTVGMWHSLVVFLISPSSPTSEDALKKASDRDFTFLIWATILVVIGMLCEAGDVFHELKRWWKTRGRKRSLVPVISAVGLLLVSIGVIGEGIYETKLGIADTGIRQIDESRAQVAGDAALKAQSQRNSRPRPQRAPSFPQTGQISQQAKSKGR